ncbi:MAG: prepilin-type N-terminal cleavage/methylation domain-containing protein, partial [Planctomycetota bacterium]
MFRRCDAFSLIELLVVLAVVALLIGLLLPVLSEARGVARMSACLSNLRQLQTAHAVYQVESDGRMLGTVHAAPAGSWVHVLRRYDEALLLRSPVDTSPHFPGGTPIAGDFRQSSYTLNFYLSPDNPVGFSKAIQVPRPSAVGHMMLLVFTGPNATSDHVHPSGWFSPLTHLIPGKAGNEVQIDAHGGNNPPSF